MYQGASQRSQLSQNSSSNCFAEFLHLVIFSRTLHVRQSLDRAFSITICVLECSLRLPCRENPAGFFKGFSKLSAKKQNKQHAQRKQNKQYQVIPPFLIIQKKPPHSCILPKVVQLLQYIGL